MKFKPSVKSIVAASLLALPALTAIPLSANAATKQAQLLVTATIQHSCSFGTNSVALNFGDLADLSLSKTSTTSFQVACTNGLPYQLGFNGGDNLDGEQRRMKLDTDYLNYQLYDGLAQQGSDPLGMDWGVNTISGVGAGLGAANYNSHPIDGLVPPQAVSGAGQYSDTVTVTLKY